MRRLTLCALLVAAPAAADDQAAIDEGKAYFLEQLKDPDSAQWRNLRAETVSKGGKITHILCGEINAKNSYGGYIGYRPFYYFSGNGEIQDGPDDWFFKDMAKSVCPK